ncbi:arsenate reductase family protein [Breznakiella homolactica]|uniref:Glutaredoxin n=1 Tax=Breznakiella homolactica TaxID=2798577 RepID=A0A7T7XJ51_9SPIR|nr:glutaredoxin [Breznakiella homolactica]QQO07365.1 glutaredoxin [Breznakiella homolactica]
MIQIFGTKKCRNTQKALRFFSDRGIEVQFRDLSVKPPSPGELDDMAKAAGGYDILIDLSGPAAEQRGLRYMDYDAREILLEDPALYKTPLVRPGKGLAAAGPDEAAWKGMVKTA